MDDVKRTVYRVTRERGRRSFPTLAAAASAAAREQAAKPYRIEIDPGGHLGEAALYGDVELVARQGKGTTQINGHAHPAITVFGRVRIEDLGIAAAGQTAILVANGSLHMIGCRVLARGDIAIEARPATMIELDDCSFDGGRVSLERAVGTILGTTFVNATNNAVGAVDRSTLKVGKCDFRDGAQHAIRATGGSTLAAVSCRMKGFANAAIAIDGRSNAAIDDCHATACRKSVVRVAEASRVAVTGLATADVFQGVEVLGSSDVKIEGSTITKTRDAGVAVGEASTVLLSGSVFRGNGAAAVYIQGESTLRMTGVQVSTGERALLAIGAHTTLDNIETEDLEVAALDLAGGGSCKATGLRLSGGGRGIFVGGSTVLTVNDSDVSGTLRSAIRIQDAARLVASALTVKDSTGNGIEAGGSSTVRLTDVSIERAGVHGVAIEGHVALAGTYLTISDSTHAGLAAGENSVLDLANVEFHRNGTGAMLLRDYVSGRIEAWSATGSDAATAVDNDSLVSVAGTASAPERDALSVAVAASPPPRAQDPASSPSVGTIGEDEAESSLGALLHDLDEMIGLAPVKDQIRTQINLVKQVRRRQEAGLAAPPMSRHLLFSGPPGTGKTTIARLYGQILAALGALPRGHLHEVGRADLVGRYVGHTAVQTREHFAKARGGILFIDEAYTLARKAGTGHDFGQEAIDELVKQMEEHRADTAVIAAGYPEEMKQFVAANPGLASRFDRTIEFPSYSPDELVEIIDLFAWQNDFDFDDEVADRLERHFASPVLGEHAGNARYARNLFERMLAQQANRLAAVAEPTVDDLRLLTVEDFEAATYDN